MLTATAKSFLPTLEYVPSNEAQTALRELRLGYVHQQVLLGFICNLALAFLLLCLWWPYGNHGPLLSWFGALAVLGMLRMQQRAHFLAHPAHVPVACGR